MNTIDSTIADKIREWFAAGRGVKVWQNLEIASGAANEVYTPGDASAPNWRYGNPTDLKPSDLQISTAETLESFRGRFKAMYWGPFVAKPSEDKAKRLCTKHGLSEDSWQWEYDDLPGYVQIRICRYVITPFEGASK